MTIEAKFYIGGHFINGERKQDVLDKFSNEAVGTYPLADEDLAMMAITSACEGFPATEALPLHKRADILDFISYSLVQDESKFAETIAQEAGKPIRQARAEVKRAQQTFKFAASCARNMEGASIRLDAAVGSEGKYGFFIRVPAGITVAISPFNFPLNLVAHKVAPAIAAGCPVILKPASYTPLTAYLLAEVIAKTELPQGAFNLIFGSGSEIGMALVKSEMVRAISFTGSAEVGREISKAAGIKRLILELGSNSAAIVDRSANLETAIPKLSIGSFAYAGQICISVQRIFVSESIYQTFLDKFIAASSRIASGNPLDEKTDMGPMISEKDAIRVESWVDEAAGQGAKLVLGGARNGAFYEPTILTKTRSDMKVMKKEVFGPVVCVVPFREFNDAIEMVNDSDYGLQAGVFTKNIDNINAAIHKLKVGGVIINDAPTYRADHMPYGGVKMSGLGREGLKYAIEELTDIRMIAIQK
jgi:acyl-CoA reductase-like NAD-dependent aldehyde dehydrogenase